MHCFSLPIRKSITSKYEEQEMMPPLEVLKCFNLKPFLVKAWTAFIDTCEVESGNLE